MAEVRKGVLDELEKRGLVKQVVYEDELKAMLDYIDSIGGKGVLLSNVRDKALYFRLLASKNGLKIPDYPLSNAITPIICENVNADELVKYLRDKYELCINPCGGDLADKMYRVAHIGNTTIEDFDNLVSKILVSVDEIKYCKELVYDR